MSGGRGRLIVGFCAVVVFAFLCAWLIGTRDENPGNVGAHSLRSSSENASDIGSEPVGTVGFSDQSGIVLRNVACRVFDERTGEGLGGCIVTESANPNADPMSWKIIKTTRTNGQFSARAGVFVHARKPGYVARTVLIVGDETRDGTGRVPVSMRPSGSVQGIVLDTAGAPIPDLPLSIGTLLSSLNGIEESTAVVDRGRRVTLRTDKDGRFRAHGLPEGTAAVEILSGSYFVSNGAMRLAKVSSEDGQDHIITVHRVYAAAYAVQNLLDTQEINCHIEPPRGFVPVSRIAVRGAPTKSRPGQYVRMHDQILESLRRSGLAPPMWRVFPTLYCPTKTLDENEAPVASLSVRIGERTIRKKMRLTPFSELKHEQCILIEQASPSANNLAEVNLQFVRSDSQPSRECPSFKILNTKGTCVASWNTMYGISHKGRVTLHLPVGRYSISPDYRWPQKWPWTFRASQFTVSIDIVNRVEVVLDEAVPVLELIVTDEFGREIKNFRAKYSGMAFRHFTGAPLRAVPLTNIEIRVIVHTSLTFSPQTARVRRSLKAGEVNKVVVQMKPN